MAKVLAGKTALVTGSTRGIGRATAERLGRDGATVFVHGRNRAEAEAVAAGIIAAGGMAEAFAADLGADGGVEALAGEVRAALQGKALDILINNAGIAPFVGFAETTPAVFSEIAAVNMAAPFFLTQALVPHMGEGGRIVVLSSVVADTYFPGILAYSASKGWVDTFVHHLAAELGPRGITVNGVAPGAIDTDMSAWLRSDEGAATAHSIQALKRIGKADDLADVVAFLAGPDSRWITGQRIDAGGGTKL